MKIWTKKRAAALGLAALLTLSLVACGEKAPSLEEVEQAIEAGTLTVEDALNQGWIDQTWVDDYYEKNAVPAVDKIEVNKVGDFTTSTLDGQEFASADLGSVTFFAFADPSDPGAEEFFQTLVDAYEGVADNGAGIVLCVKSEDGTKCFDDAPFPVILYNDSVKAATDNNREMIQGLPFTASWYVNGSFLSAWYSTVEAEELAESAAAYVQMEQDIESNDQPNSSSATGMVPMG